MLLYYAILIKNYCKTIILCYTVIKKLSKNNNFLEVDYGIQYFYISIGADCVMALFAVLILVECCVNLPNMIQSDY